MDREALDRLCDLRDVSCSATLALFCNFASGPAIVAGNKLVFAWAGFHYPTVLTCLHYFATWLGVRCLAYCGAFRALPRDALYASDRKSDGRVVVALVVAWSMYNIASNQSLSANSVGVYQMMKLLMTPLAVAWDAAMYNRWPTFAQAVLLCISVLGVGLCTSTSKDVSVFGILVALLAVSFAIVQKGLTSHVTQHACEVMTPLQLLDWAMPWMGVITMASALLLDDCWELWQYDFNPRNMKALLASALSGIFANLSSTWVLGTTSPLAMILLGQLKTVLVLLVGYLFFDSKPGALELLGASMAVVAIGFYTWSKLRAHGGARKERKDYHDEAAERQLASDDVELQALKEDDATVVATAYGKAMEHDPSPNAAPHRRAANLLLDVGSFKEDADMAP
mmetsp:Transcript_58784/g.164087  ORF Transcript_58784/g.164087 Transcript_58784/m.164087 type:complete len:396 (+) Transcript_58784:39-1226(+)